MLTQTQYLTIALAAGPDFTWAGGGTARPETEVRAGIMAHLIASARGVCAFCGMVNDGAWEVCHIASGGYGNGRKGWMPGNLAAGCIDCNDVDGDNGPLVAYETIVRPDLIVTEWPTRAELREIGKAEKAKREANRESKRIARGM